MLFKVGSQLVIDHLIHQGTDIGVAQLRLGLAFKLGVGQFDGNNGRDTFPAVLATDFIIALNNAVFHAVVV